MSAAPHTMPDDLDAADVGRRVAAHVHADELAVDQRLERIAATERVVLVGHVLVDVRQASAAPFARHGGLPAARSARHRRSRPVGDRAVVTRRAGGTSRRDGARLAAAPQASRRLRRTGRRRGRTGGRTSRRRRAGGGDRLGRRRGRALGVAGAVRPASSPERPSSRRRGARRRSDGRRLAGADCAVAVGVVGATADFAAGVRAGVAASRPRGSVAASASRDRRRRRGGLRGAAAVVVAGLAAGGVVDAVRSGPPGRGRAAASPRRGRLGRRGGCGAARGAAAARRGRSPAAMRPRRDAQRQDRVHATTNLRGRCHLPSVERSCRRGTGVRKRGRGVRIQAVGRGGELGRRSVAARRPWGCVVELQVRDGDDAAHVRQLGEERADLVVAAVHRDLRAAARCSSCSRLASRRAGTSRTATPVCWPASVILRSSTGSWRSVGSSSAAMAQRSCSCSYSASKRGRSATVARARASSVDFFS